MKYRSIVALALSASAAIAVSSQQAFAQRVSNDVYRSQATRPAAGPIRGGASAAYVEELPGTGQIPQQSPPSMQADPFSDDSFSMQHYGAADPYGDGYFADSGDACASSCDTGPSCCGSESGQFFVRADYLYVRASFSEALAFIEVDNTQQGLNEREFNQFDFEYESSFRVGGGYRLCGCGDEIRFLYTRFDSSAEDETPFDVNIFVPFEVVGEPGGRNLFDADVEINSYDLEYAKTIPLGGACCECSDPCGSGCGECCKPCPAWDITWSGGIRAAEAEWERTYTALGAQDQLVSDAVSTMDFDGVGLKVGLEGRRYFFKNGCLSLYAKGDISVLYGNLEFEAVRTEDGGSAPDSVIEQSMDTEQLIPVTELEAGLSGQVTCNARVSAGYLLSAWHDLGFRDEFETAAQAVFPLSYDDANILGFDGFFARFEYGF